jgi:hypothetical protein
MTRRSFVRATSTGVAQAEAYTVCRISRTYANTGRHPTRPMGKKASVSRHRHAILASTTTWILEAKPAGMLRSPTVSRSAAATSPFSHGRRANSEIDRCDYRATSVKSAGERRDRSRIRPGRLKGGETFRQPASATQWLQRSEKLRHLACSCLGIGVRLRVEQLTKAAISCGCQHRPTIDGGNSFSCGSASSWRSRNDSAENCLKAWNRAGARLCQHAASSRPCVRLIHA